MAVAVVGELIVIGEMVSVRAAASAVVGLVIETKEIIIIHLSYFCCLQLFLLQLTAIIFSSQYTDLRSVMRWGVELGIISSRI